MSYNSCRFESQKLSFCVPKAVILLCNSMGFPHTIISVVLGKIRFKIIQIHLHTASKAFEKSKKVVKPTKHDNFFTKVGMIKIL